MHESQLYWKHFRPLAPVIRAQAAIKLIAVYLSKPATVHIPLRPDAGFCYLKLRRKCARSASSSSLSPCTDADMMVSRPGPRIVAKLLHGVQQKSFLLTGESGYLLATGVVG